MIKTLLKQIGEYKKDTIITPIFTVLEVVAELLVPFVIASLIDKGIEAGNLRNVYLYGALMIVLAFFGLVFGILAGRFAASASSGFACNLRRSMFENIQTFSFSNIDKFSTAGLVTRMTTDVTNMQMAFQMCLRIALRAPLMLICSMVMCLLINAKLSMIFLAAIVVLAVALAFIMSKAMKIFSKVFHRYDDLNASVQENISAIRVVKAFVREDYTERYNGYVARYDAAKVKLDALQKEKAQRLAQADSIGGFMFELSEYTEAITEFDEGLWLAVIEKATAYHDGRLVFTFQNGVSLDG